MNYSRKIKIILALSVFFIILISLPYYLGRRLRSKSDDSKNSTLGIHGDTKEIISDEVIETPIPSKKPNLALSSTPSPTPSVKIKILFPDANLDGFRSSNASGNQYLEIRAGRNINFVTRGFVSFALDDLPEGAKIISATIKLYQTKVIGHPYNLLGIVKVDHLTYGDSLDDSDYGMPSLVSNISELPKGDSPGWKTAEVGMAVKDDIANGRSYTQFRIHFTSETTGTNELGDFVYFESAENIQKAGNIPELEIRYY